MNAKILTLLLLLSILIALKCTSKSEFFYTENKLKYKILTISGENEKLKIGDYIQYSRRIFDSNGTYYEEDDNDSYSFLLLNENCKGGLHEGFFKLSVGDSAIFYIKSQLFFECHLKENIPDFFENDEIIEIHIKVQDAAKDVSKLKMNAFKLYSDSEQLLINELLSEWKLEMDTIIHHNNLYIALYDTCNDTKIEKGNKVKFIHATYKLNKTLIEQTTLQDPFEYISGQQDQVIEGIRIAISNMCYNQKARLLIPYNQSFSENFRIFLGINKDPIICELYILSK